MNSLVKTSPFLFGWAWLTIFFTLSLAVVEGVREVCSWRSPFLLYKACPLQMGEAPEANSEEHHPWTHKPFCLSMKVLGMGMPKVCVYTSSKSNQKGISFITTLDTASEIVQNSAAVLQSRSRLAHEHPPYKVTELPGKGKGVVATQTIQPLEVFMEDFPSLIVDSVLLPTNTTKPVGMDRLLSLATDQLLDRERVLSLATSGKDRNIVVDVIGTNAFEVDFNGREHKGLYPDIAVSAILRGFATWKAGY